MRLGLVSCTKSKQSYPCKAEEMYQPSALFGKAYRYATENYDEVAILSAKYGLLLPDEVIEPYELTLKTMSKQKRLEWAERVFKQMDDKIGLSKIDLVAFHTGVDYREYLIPKLKHRNIEYVVTLEGLSFGQQLKWYNNQRNQQ